VAWQARNSSLKLSHSTAGHVVVVVFEHERRPVRDGARDPNAANSNYFSKASLLPTVRPLSCAFACPLVHRSCSLAAPLGETYPRPLTHAAACVPTALLRQDPPPWAAPDGRACAREEPRLLLPGWRWQSEWRAVVDPHDNPERAPRTDRGGWQYAFGPLVGHRDAAWKPIYVFNGDGVRPWQRTFFRRRRWERMVAPPSPGTVMVLTAAQLSRPLPPRPSSMVSAQVSFEMRYQVALRRQPRVMDKEVSRCTQCATLFRLTTRRHHCRSCGGAQAVASSVVAPL
jgi:hypothetical protein